MGPKGEGASHSKMAKTERNSWGCSNIPIQKKGSIIDTSHYPCIDALSPLLFYFRSNDEGASHSRAGETDLN